MYYWFLHATIINRSSHLWDVCWLWVDSTETWGCRVANCPQLCQINLRVHLHRWFSSLTWSGVHNDIQTLNEQLQRDIGYSSWNTSLSDWSIIILCSVEISQLLLCSWNDERFSFLTTSILSSYQVNLWRKKPFIINFHQVYVAIICHLHIYADCRTGVLWCVLTGAGELWSLFCECHALYTMSSLVPRHPDLFNRHERKRGSLGSNVTWETSAQRHGSFREEQ